MALTDESVRLILQMKEAKLVATLLLFAPIGSI